MKALLVVAALASAAHADRAEEIGGAAAGQPNLTARKSPRGGDDDARPKKDRERAAKSTQHGPVPAPGAKPAPLVNLYNAWTHEWLAVDARQPPAPATVDRFLRDHYTNQPTPMEPRLVGLVASAARDFRSDVAVIVSGFRHPKYNLILRKKGHQVARDSQHTHGTAIDFYIPRIPTRVLHRWAKTHRIGGVGVYLGSGFVHMDSGKVRDWSGE